MKFCKFALAGAALALLGSPVVADKLDDVIDEGTLRCGVVLDFPPIGYRDENNDPAGFDVEYCKDLAAALDVDYEILPLTWAERLPVIVTNRADVVFGATSDTLERAKTVGFTIPYAIYYAQAVVGKDSGVVTFEDLKGVRVAAAVGTVPEQEFLKYAEEWGTEDLYQGYQSENEVFLAVAQGKADVGITTNTAVKPIVDQYETVIAGPRMPWTTRLHFRRRSPEGRNLAQLPEPVHHASGSIGQVPRTLGHLRGRRGAGAPDPGSDVLT